MSFSQLCRPIFEQSIQEYHIKDDVNQPINNPFEQGTIQALLYHKSWIDTVQWHVEDLIREPSIDADLGIKYKRRIDALNQQRTDRVEQIDDYFLIQYQGIALQSDARVNTESPAWAIDRLSILALKIYHMQEAANRADASAAKREECKAKLQVLLEQQEDLSQSIDELLEDLADGRKKMKVYRQMKMYNDPELNPVLYGKK